MTIAPARSAALTALDEIEAGRRDLPAALAAVRSRLADERDRALVNDLVIGTLRWRGQLDFLIAHFAGRPVAKLDLAVLEILRLATYQLLHLERVPASAAVNDAVALTRRARKTSAAGLVNAVLRAISRSRHRLPLPVAPPEGDPIAYLSVTLSHPEWLVRRWLNRFGFDAAQGWAAFNNAAAPLTLRVNPFKSNAEDLAAALGGHGVEVRRARYARDALVVVSGNPLLTPLASSGAFVVQDEASQLVALLGAPEAGQRVLDTCASPGGKTTGMAAAARDAAVIVAADVRPARVQLLRETVKASGARSIRIVQADLERGLPFGASFDVVFVDAPCSGLGTLRRDPDIKWRRREADLAPLAAAQVRMLANAAQAVRDGGRLVYSTCSSEPDENDDVVARFLESAPTFRQIDLRQERPHPFDELEPVLDDAGVLRTSPAVHGLEAFYGTVLRRVE